MIRVTLGVLLAASTIALMPGDARAGTVEVFPGNGTLQAAINGAPEGSRLTLHPGVFNGAVVATKRVTIECLHDASNDGGCLIDAQCAAPIALDIAADKVIVKMSKKKILGAGGGPLVIARGVTTGVRIANHTNVKLSRVQVVNGYLGLPCGTEQVGIEISGTSSGIKLDESYFPAEAVAGVHITGLPLGSKVGIQRMQTSVGLNQIGLLIENSSVGAVLGKGGISVKQSILPVAGSSGTAVRLVNSDGVRFTKNLTFVNPSPEVALTGYSLDSGSDHNLFLTNTWSDSEADETPYADSGTGNCGKGNNFVVPACP